ncbi:ABC transporter substrate-binding protein [Cetobacterium somerae]|uniref:ABC transporter substrate-binding protein n=1 Tax=Cetobacterium somerae TaxID=188913 RepID=UPI003D76A3A3
MNRNFFHKYFTIFFILNLLFITNHSFCKENNYIVVAQGSKPKSLDPHTFNEFPTLGITEHIFNTLVTLDENGTPVPELAKDFKYLSPTEILFTIRENVKFHNGDILTPDDVIFSLERMIEKPGSRIILKDIKSVSKTSSNDVLITLKEPSAPFLANLTLPIAAIMNKKYIQDGNNVALNPMGTGPYMVKNWGNGDKIILKSFKDYFKGSPQNEGLIFKIITENTSRLAALETGEVDIIYAISPIDFQTVEKNPNLNLLNKTTTTTELMVLNVEKEGLNDKNVRKAIHMAVDKEGILEAIFLSKGSIATSPINPNIFGSYQGLKPLNHNIEEAKKLIRDKGKLPSLKIWTSENIVRVQIAQIIQANLKEIGIDSTIEIVEWGTFLKRTSEGAHDILLTTWILGVSDIDTVVTTLFHSASIGAEGNRSFYNNPNLDKEIDLARSTTDSEKRKEHYKTVQEIILDENPIIPLVYKIDGIGINKRIQNFDYNKASMRNYYENMKKVDVK